MLFEYLAIGIDDYFDYDIIFFSGLRKVLFN